MPKKLSRNNSNPYNRDCLSDADMRIATMRQATDWAADKVIAAPTWSVDDGEGRSPWVWITLADGDVMLACYPMGDLYEEVSRDF